MKIIVLLSVLLAIGCSTNRIKFTEPVKIKGINTTEKYAIAIKCFEDSTSINHRNNLDSTSIFKRKVISRNLNSLNITENGTTILKVCINQGGDVTMVELLETSLKNEKNIKETIKSAADYKYEADYSAPCEQCGKLTFSFDFAPKKVKLELNNTYFLTEINLNGHTYTNHYNTVEKCLSDSTIEKLQPDTSQISTHRRKVIYRNYESLPMTESGKFVIKTCINKNGDVVSASMIKSNSNSKRFLEKLLTAAIGYKYESDINGPCIECGMMTITTSINGK